MPAGDLVVADYQAELRATLMGASSNYQIAPPGIAGLGLPPVKSADTELGHADGSVAADDFRGVRVITIPLIIGGDSAISASTAMTRFTTLLTAWAPSTSDIPLYIRLPGWGKFHVNGRPRGLDEDLSQLKNGLINVLATFHALDPTITTP